MTHYSKSNTNFSDKDKLIQQDIIGNNNQTIGQVYGSIIIYQIAQDKVQKHPESSSNPYKGLSAFKKKDWNNFCGRSREIEVLFALLEKLYNNNSSVRFLPVYGYSASGKSSLVQAGLLHKLSCTPLTGCEGSIAAVLVPGETPIKSLAQKLTSIYKNTFNPSEVDIEEVHRRLIKPNERGEYDGLYCSVINKLPKIETNFPLILIVDQFEEIYSRCQNKSERNLFINNLLYAAKATSRYVSVIITFRDDFSGELSKHPKLDKLFTKQGYRTFSIDKENLREVIIQPAKNAGYSFDEATVELLIQETYGRRGALPLLQFALKIIWNNLSKGISPVNTLKRIDGVGGALSKEAQRIYEQLNQTQQAIARRLFLGLVQVQLKEDGQDSRCRVAFEDIITQIDSSKEFYEVVEIFSEPTIRLITLSYDGKVKLEITHEALLEHWQQLKKWLTQGRDKLKQKRRIENAAQEWQALDKHIEYLLGNTKLREARNFQKHEYCNYPLSKLAQNFIAKSIENQKIKQVKSLILFMIIPILGTVIVGSVIVREIALNTDKKLIRDCREQYDCEGRIEALERLVEANKSLKSFNLKGSNLQGSNLQGADLTRANLENANLQGTDLTAANLFRANLKGANLFRADLEAANLRIADLEAANLEMANLRSVYFDGSNLKGTNLKTAYLESATLDDAYLEGTYLVKVEKLTFSQIKSACHWEKAFYKGDFDDEKGKFIIEESANQKHIMKLKHDKASNSTKKINCTKF